MDDQQAAPVPADAAMDGILKHLADKASYGTAQVYERYVSNLVDLVDDYAARLRPEEAARFLAYAEARHDYVPKSERVSLAAQGLCPCGLGEMTCPNGHFEHDDFPGYGSGPGPDDFDPLEKERNMPAEGAVLSEEAPPRLYVSPASVLLLQAERRLSNPLRWRKGQMETSWPWTRHCVRGAVDWADENYDLGRDGEGKRAALVALEHVVRGRGFADPAVFNDHPATTRRDVREVLTEAAAAAMVTASEID